MTEGPYMIRIGDEFQASVPILSNDLDLSQFDPGSLEKHWEGLDVDGWILFYEQARRIVCEIKGAALLNSQHTAASSSSSSKPSFLVDGSFVVLNADLHELLHRLLHTSGYNKETAIALLPETIVPLVTVWTCQEVAEFRAFLSKNDYDLEKLRGLLPAKNSLEISEYFFRYFQAASELESQVAGEDTVRSLIQKFRDATAGQTTPIRQVSCSDFLLRFSLSFDSFTYQQLLSILSNTMYLRPADMVTHVRSIVECGIFRPSDGSYKGKSDGMRDFLSFLPHKVGKKLLDGLR